MKRRLKSAFTLMEVNLAIFIMAVGALTLVALYPFGFKETEQSREDVMAAATADDILNQVAATLSATNVPWSKWKAIKGAGKNSSIFPAQGWYDYVGKSRAQQKQLAQQAFNKLMGAAGASSITPRFPSSDKMCIGMVLNHSHPNRISVSVRVSRTPAAMMAQPVYYTEVYFNGDPDK